MCRHCHIYIIFFLSKFNQIIYFFSLPSFDFVIPLCKPIYSMCTENQIFYIEIISLIFPIRRKFYTLNISEYRNIYICPYTGIPLGLHKKIIKKFYNKYIGNSWFDMRIYNIFFYYSYIFWPILVLFLNTWCRSVFWRGREGGGANGFYIKIRQKNIYVYILNFALKEKKYVPSWASLERPWLCLWVTGFERELVFNNFIQTPQKLSSSLGGR